MNIAPAYSCHMGVIRLVLGFVLDSAKCKIGYHAPCVRYVTVSSIAAYPVRLCERCGDVC